MKREQTKREQIGPVNAKTTLPVRQINWLVTSWAFPFRLFIYPFVRPERFDCLYRSEERRQPESVRITASLLLIQKIFNKTDDEMHDWIMGADAALRFATDTLAYSVEKFTASDQQLSQFRMKCQEYAGDHDENPLDTCIQDVEYGLSAFMDMDPKNVRSDSNDISANMTHLGRETRFYFANRRMLIYLVNQNNPNKKEAIEKAHLEHYLEPNDRNSFFFQSGKKRENRQKRLAEDANRILQICDAEDAESSEGKLYTWILSEQTVEKMDVCQSAKTEDGVTASTLYQHPNDKEAISRMKLGRKFIGYIKSFAEAIRDGESQSVSGNFEQNVVNDPVMAMAFLKEAGDMVTGIERYNQILGIGVPDELKKCQTDLLKTMKLVNERILAEKRTGRKIPGSMCLDTPVEEEKEELSDNPMEATQMSMDDLLNSDGNSYTNQ